METADVEGDVIQFLACRLRLALHTRLLRTGLQTEMTRSILKLKTVSKRLALTNLWFFLRLGLVSVVSCTSSPRSIVVSWHFVLLLLAVEQNDGTSAPRRKFDEQGATLPLGGDRQEQGVRLVLFLEEVVNVQEPQIQVSVLERIDEEIVAVTKQ